MQPRESEIVILFIVVFTILLLLAFSFIYFFVLFLQKKQRAHKMKIIEIGNNFEKEVFKTQIQVQEQTFKSISAEIHDNIGQRLTLAKLQLNIALGNPSLEEVIRQGIRDAVSGLTDCISDLRDLSRNLSYERIGILGFQEMIQADLRQLNAVHPIECHYVRNGELHFLGIETELVIYRIFQEVIQNTIKHSNAKNFFAHLIYQKQYLKISFEDDGVGFELNGTNLLNGLNNLKARAKSIHAALDIQSSVGLGTKILIKIPYNESIENKNHLG